VSHLVHRVLESRESQDRCGIVETTSKKSEGWKWKKTRGSCLTIVGDDWREVRWAEVEDMQEWKRVEDTQEWKRVEDAQEWKMRGSRLGRRVALGTTGEQRAGVKDTQEWKTRIVLEDAWHWGQLKSSQRGGSG
jgi:hypothetical protein